MSHLIILQLWTPGWVTPVVFLLYLCTSLTPQSCFSPLLSPSITFFFPSTPSKIKAYIPKLIEKLDIGKLSLGFCISGINQIRLANWKIHYGKRHSWVEGGDDIHTKELTAMQSSRNDSPKGPKGCSHLCLYDAHLKKKRKCLHFSLKKLLSWNFIMAACHPL